MVLFWAFPASSTCIIQSDYTYRVHYKFQQIFLDPFTHSVLETYAYILIAPEVESEIKWSFERSDLDDSRGQQPLTRRLLLQIYNDISDWKTKVHGFPVLFNLFAIFSNIRATNCLVFNCNKHKKSGF